MLVLNVPDQEMFNRETQQFVTPTLMTLELEHSLASLSKWESIYEKPFLGKEEKTGDEVTAYVKCMTLTPDVPDEIFEKLSSENLQDINAYLEAKMSGTSINERAGAPRTREVITSELIYYWMTVFNIPFECENWHLNRLFTLIRICNIKQAGPKKMSRREAAAQQRELNSQRRARTGSKG